MDLFIELLVDSWERRMYWHYKIAMKRLLFLQSKAFYNNTWNWLFGIKCIKHYSTSLQLRKKFFQSFSCNKKACTSYIHKGWQYWCLEKDFQTKLELFQTLDSTGSSYLTFAQGWICQKEVKSIDKKQQKTTLILHLDLIQNKLFKMKKKDLHPNSLLL